LFKNLDIKSNCHNFVLNDVYCNTTVYGVVCCSVYYENNVEIYCPNVDSNLKLSNYAKKFDNINFDVVKNFLFFRFCDCVPILFQTCLYTRIHYLMENQKNKRIFYNCYLESNNIIIYNSITYEYLNKDYIQQKNAM